jgi:putative membrane protein
MLRSVSWTAVAGVLLLAGCNSSTTPDDATASDAAGADTAATMPIDSPTDGAMAGDASTPTTAQAFADAAAASDTFELESSRLAQKMGKSAAVKDFAAMMIKDHTKSTADLKTAASKASPAVTPAPKMTAEQQSNLDALKSATGNFDQLYGQQQVAAHEKALAMLQGYASGGDTASLKDFASKTAPVVSGHLEHARSLPK